MQVREARIIAVEIEDRDGGKATTQAAWVTENLQCREIDQLERRQALLGSALGAYTPPMLEHIRQTAGISRRSHS